MSNPRRLAWSFLCVRKCSVSSPMRAVSKAICTSGDPVSLGSSRNWSIISVLRSFVIDISVLTASAVANSCLMGPSVHTTRFDLREFSNWQGDCKGSAALLAVSERHIILGPGPPLARRVEAHRAGPVELPAGGVLVVQGPQHPNRVLQAIAQAGHADHQFRQRGKGKPVGDRYPLGQLPRRQLRQLLGQVHLTDARPWRLDLDDAV